MQHCKLLRIALASAILGALVFGADAPASAVDGLARAESLSKAFSSIASNAGAGRQMGQGSGFFIAADGYLLTNNHVVAGEDRISVQLRDGRSFEAQVVGTDAASDVALLRAAGAEGMPALAFADSEELEVGEWVVAIGNPLGLSATVTVGINTAIFSRGGGSMGIGFATPANIASR